MDTKKQALRVAIAGPTATGKTAVAVRLAQMLGGEIISADSMQIWRGMDIGTAKPDLSERGGVRFHLIDCLDFDQPFSVVQFQSMASDALGDITQRGKVAILAGGTGLYVRALVDGTNFPPQAPPETRAKLRAEIAELGSQALHERLRLVDPATADRLAPADAKRIVRALEVYETTGRPILAYHGQEPEEREEWAMFGLACDTQKLVRRIDDRVDLMMRCGLLDEVRSLVEKGLRADMQSARALGYAEILSHLAGDMTLDDAINKIKTNTRRYAKRQRTWFRQDPRIVWVRADDRSPEDIAGEIARQIA